MSHAMVELPKAVVNRVKIAMAYSDDDVQKAEDLFLERCPRYQQTRSLDALRASDYARLDSLGHVYLDYTGGGIYAASQLQQHMKLLSEGVYGNPHSVNPTSMAMTHLDESARKYVLQFFNADPEEYIVVFTPNASGALKLVGESYPFDENGQYLLTFDNHNSVNGIREFARRKGAKFTYTPVLPPDLRLDETRLRENLGHAIPGGNNLFAFPAQSNFSGVQHSLGWIEIAHELGWDVLVDCAAFAPTNYLDLSRWKPDFVPLSFYKIFGYPTGIGALLIHRRVLPKLHRPWFAGGTITIASVQADAHYLEEDEAAFEDGTIDYLNLPAVEIGLRHMEKMGIDKIHDRVLALTEYLLDELTILRHDNGAPLVQIYGPITTEARGGTIALNLYDPQHQIFDYKHVEVLANHAQISLRTGCFCNPGAGESAFAITREEIQACLQETDRMTFEQLVTALTSQTEHDAVGAIRISVGLVTNFRDVFHGVQFFKTFLNQDAASIVMT